MGSQNEGGGEGGREREGERGGRREEEKGKEGRKEGLLKTCQTGPMIHKQHNSNTSEVGNYGISMSSSPVYR